MSAHPLACGVGYVWFGPLVGWLRESWHVSTNKPQCIDHFIQPLYGVYMQLNIPLLIVHAEPFLHSKAYIVAMLLL